MPVIAGLGAAATLLAQGFVGFSVTYEAGTTSIPIPTGATGYRIRGVAGGGGGASTITDGGGGGGGGGFDDSGTVLPGEWGTNLTCAIGAAGLGETAPSASNATNGGNTTVSGTIGGVAISLLANGGVRTNGAAGGAGGATGSGADFNYGGSAGLDGSSGGTGGAAGIILGNSRGIGGQGGTGGGAGGDGVAGRIIVDWT